MNETGHIFARYFFYFMWASIKVPAEVNFTRHLGGIVAHESKAYSKKEDPKKDSSYQEDPKKDPLSGGS